MADTYALWDRDSGNVIGSYLNEAGALDAVRGILVANGRVVARRLLLVREDEQGIPKAIANGSDLALRALLSGEPDLWEAVVDAATDDVLWKRVKLSEGYVAADVDGDRSATFAAETTSAPTAPANRWKLARAA